MPQYTLMLVMIVCIIVGLVYFIRRGVAGIGWIIGLILAGVAAFFAPGILQALDTPTLFWLACAGIIVVIAGASIGITTLINRSLEKKATARSAEDALSDLDEMLAEEEARSAGKKSKRADRKKKAKKDILPPEAEDSAVETAPEEAPTQDFKPPLVEAEEPSPQEEEAPPTEPERREPIAEAPETASPEEASAPTLDAAEQSAEPLREASVEEQSPEEVPKAEEEAEEQPLEEAPKAEEDAEEQPSEETPEAEEEAEEQPSEEAPEAETKEEHWDWEDYAPTPMSEYESHLRSEDANIEIAPPDLEAPPEEAAEEQAEKASPPLYRTRARILPMPLQKTDSFAVQMENALELCYYGLWDKAVDELTRLQGEATTRSQKKQVDLTLLQALYKARRLPEAVDCVFSILDKQYKLTDVESARVQGVLSDLQNDMQDDFR